MWVAILVPRVPLASPMMLAFLAWTIVILGDVSKRIDYAVKQHSINKLNI